MPLKSNIALLALLAAALTGCGEPQAPDSSAPAAAAGATAGTPATPEPPYHPIATVKVLMNGTIEVAADDYWSSVSIVVDADGVHENAPANADEWHRVWSAGITLAESGNLLMMPTRALDQGDWMRMSRDLVDVGLEAARAANAEDFEAVLAMGEEIYNVCTACHRQYVPALPDL